MDAVAAPPVARDPGPAPPHAAPTRPSAHTATAAAVPDLVLLLLLLLPTLLLALAPVGGAPLVLPTASCSTLRKYVRTLDPDALTTGDLMYYYQLLNYYQLFVLSLNNFDVNAAWSVNAA